MQGHLRRIIFFQVRFPRPAGLGPAQSSPALLSLVLPPFGITSRQNMQSLWLVAQQGADSKCPRQKLFHIPQQEGLQPSSKKMDLLRLLSSSQKRFVPRLYSKVRLGFDFVAIFSARKVGDIDKATVIQRKFNRIILETPSY